MDAADVYGCEERGGVFGITCSDSAPLLKVQEGIFNEMAEPVDFFVIVALFFAISLWRDNRLHALRLSLFHNRICIIAPVGQQVFGADAFNQTACLSAICCCTFCNNNPERHTMRIHGQMQFCVEPPFVRPIP